MMTPTKPPPSPLQAGPSPVKFQLSLTSHFFSVHPTLHRTCSTLLSLVLPAFVDKEFIGEKVGRGAVEETVDRVEEREKLDVKSRDFDLGLHQRCLERIVHKSTQAFNLLLPNLLHNHLSPSLSLLLSPLHPPAVVEQAVEITV
eukprot:CAMPEP_0118653606 /NCGR_PEP_ID=MMETSP0785-20121206/11916_1 /TAXON_ID=91992 /ORGANISM="Bolidomonas pacifica, Strain CCMP 1866" /LENGTH=143 /DNA_ID=CAMNT_0006546151 /DNA_START=337 /DNA_END=765 /DNA_ORIENTATION=+